MKKFILQRTLLALLTLFGITIIVFSLMHLAPGDPVSVIAGRETDAKIVAAIRKEWGFDQPIYIQYFTWLGKALHGDFGMSFVNRMNVTDLIASRLPYTLKLNAIASVLGLCIAFPVGILSAVKKYSVFDYVATFFALLSQSMPSFWLSLMMISLFTAKLGWLPSSGSETWLNYIMPAFVLGTTWAAGLTRIIRSSMLEVLGEDYVRTARAKGLKESVVVYRHALRNAMIPIATSLAYWIAYLVTGSVIVEVIFALPGIGRLMISSLSNRDYFVVQAVILLTSSAVLIANLAVDILYCVIDPRIRYD